MCLLNSKTGRCRIKWMNSAKRIQERNKKHVIVWDTAPNEGTAEARRLTTTNQPHPNGSGQERNNKNAETITARWWYETSPPSTESVSGRTEWSTIISDRTHITCPLFGPKNRFHNRRAPNRLGTPRRMGCGSRESEEAAQRFTLVVWLASRTKEHSRCPWWLICRTDCLRTLVDQANVYNMQNLPKSPPHAHSLNIFIYEWKFPNPFPLRCVPSDNRGCRIFSSPRPSNCYFKKTFVFFWTE